MDKFTNNQKVFPGKNAEILLERRKNIVPQGVSNGIPTFAKTSKGVLIEDVDGNTFIDFVGAIGTINVGHGHPKVKEALHNQIEQYIHTGFNVMMYEPYIELAEKLAVIAPGDFEKQVLFLNSGAEAVENAIKIARKYTKRPAIISFSRGYHGRTLLTMTMTSKVKPYKYEFGPFAPEVYKAPYPYFYRKPSELTDEQYEELIIQQFKDFFINDVAPETVAAVILEPVQGEGGFIVPSKKFIQTVYNTCKEHGILFISDEIQAGFGRTGSYFGIEHFDVVPDLITVSKSMAAGLPISGVIGRKEVMSQATPGELGGTYAGSPLGCAAALAVLEIIKEEKLNERAQQIGHTVLSTFNRFKEKFSIVGDARGLGAMCAIEIVTDKESKIPNKEATNAIIVEANKRGLLLMSAGAYGNVIRLLMPLVISDNELATGLNILEDSIESVVKESFIVSST